MKIKMCVLALVILLLTACSNEGNSWVGVELPASTKPVQEEITASPSVIVYGISSVTNGFVVAAEDRKKWIVTIASAVAEHPNALIETSEGQLLKAEVVAINVEHNIAMLTFKNTATIDPFTLGADFINETVTDVGTIELGETGELLSFTSVTREKDEQKLQLVQPSQIAELLKEAQESPLKWQERNAKSEQLLSYETIGTDLLNKIGQYDKDTFDYNPDALLAFVNRFQQQFNVFNETGDITPMKQWIASDDLLEQLQQIEEPLTLGELKVQSISISDNQYIIECKTTVIQADKEETELKAIYNVIQSDGNWKLIAASFS